jgi:hypothetical protein
MKSKEEILFSYPQVESEPYGHVPINRIYEAMDKYAAEVHFGYKKWIDFIVNGETELMENMKLLSDEELFSIYIEAANKISSKLP